jgi:hypothetical protein
VGRCNTDILLESLELDNEQCRHGSVKTDLNNSHSSGTALDLIKDSYLIGDSLCQMEIRCALFKNKKRAPIKVLKPFTLKIFYFTHKFNDGNSHTRAIAHIFKSQNIYFESYYNE